MRNYITKLSMIPFVFVKTSDPCMDTLDLALKECHSGFLDIQSALKHVNNSTAYA